MIEKFTAEEAERCALYIVDWLCTRNAGELEPALDEMTVRSRRDMVAELALILRHGGRPPNWVPSAEKGPFRS